MNYKKAIFNKDGHFGSYGGRYVPELLVPIMDDLSDTFFKAIKDKEFLGELNDLYQNYVGRPSPLVHLKNLSDKLGGAQIYLKNEGLNHTGAHKINHCLGQGLLAKKMRKKPRPRPEEEWEYDPFGEAATGKRAKTPRVAKSKDKKSPGSPSKGTGKKPKKKEQIFTGDL